MFSAGEFGGKYAVGKMAEIMIASSEAIFKMQEEVYNASRELLIMEKIPAVCTSSSTCIGDQLSSVHKKTPINRRTSLPTRPKPKNLLDPRLEQLYQKLMDLERVGRSEWLKVFMYISNYMRVLRPIARGKWDEPEKFVQRQTLTLDGPYPGISDDLIALVDDKPFAISHFDNIGRKSSTDSVPDKRIPIKIKNMELRSLGDDHEEYLFKTSSGPQRPSKYDRRVLCDCLKVVNRSPSGSETRRKLHLVEKMRPKYYRRYNYCEE